MYDTLPQQHKLLGQMLLEEGIHERSSVGGVVCRSP